MCEWFRNIVLASTLLLTSCQHHNVDTSSTQATSTTFRTSKPPKLLVPDYGNIKMPYSEGMPLGDIKIYRVTGRVTWKDFEGNDRGQLLRGQVMHEGASIITGIQSSASIMLSNGSLINLGGLSYLEFEIYAQEPYDFAKGMYLTLEEDPSLSKCHLNLWKGELLAVVPKLRDDSVFQIEGPYGTIQIARGIYYFGMGYDKDTGDCILHVGTIRGVATLDTPVEDKLEFNDQSVAKSLFNPYLGSKLYEIPPESLAQVGADGNSGMCCFRVHNVRAEKSLDELYKSLTRKKWTQLNDKQTREWMLNRVK